MAKKSARSGTPSASSSTPSSSEVDRLIKKIKHDLDDTDKRMKALDKAIKARKEGSSAANDADISGQLDQILKSIHEGRCSTDEHK